MAESKQGWSDYEVALRAEARRYGVGPGRYGLGFGFIKLPWLRPKERERAIWLNKELTRLENERNEDSWSRLREIAKQEPDAEEPPE